jgi:hypothetical protein
MNQAVSGGDAESPARDTRLFPRIVAGLGAAACFVVVAAMLVSHRPAVVGRSEPAPAAATLKFANPFDPTEVFEFPAGTTAEEAQERVAETLLQRAQERVPTAPNAASATAT